MLKYLHEIKGVGFDFDDWKENEGYSKGEGWNTLMLASLNEKQNTTNESYFHIFRKNNFEVKDSTEMVRYIQESYSIENEHNKNKLINHYSGKDGSAFLVACSYANDRTVDYIFRTCTSGMDDQEKNIFLNCIIFILSFKKEVNSKNQ
jgi:hypothetical protein